MSTATVQIQIHYQIGPQAGMNVIHMHTEDAVDPQDADYLTLDAIGAWSGALEGFLMACLPVDVTLLGYKGRRITPTGGPTITVATSGIAGLRSGDFSAGSIGPCVVTAYPKLDGVWRTGKMFLPAVSETDISQNVFSAGLQGVLQTFRDNLVLVQPGPLTSWEWFFGVWSPKFSTWYPPSAISISGRPGTQRGRLKPSF